MARGALIVVAFVLVVGVGALVLLGRDGTAPGGAPSLRVAEIMGDETSPFAQADRVRAFDFPTDHGPHPDYRNEWWYFTGNLSTEDGRAFGYQLTFFRTALAPEGDERASAWGTRQIYMAHAALSDVEGRRIHAFERFSRDALELAGARAAPFRVWLEDWSAASEGEGEAFLPLVLRARQGDVAFTLHLEPDKPLVLQGDRGLSAKSRDAGHASYYYSHTRMTTRGRVELDGRTFEVTGQSWLDREWGSSALGRTQVGWDWFAIQLDDGTDLMLAQVREQDGRAPFRGGSIVSPTGRIEVVGGEAFELEVLDRWQSPVTGATYPSGWQLRVPSREIALDVVPAFPDQELPLSILYWEGATRITGSVAGRAVQGVGYTELTGYGDASAR